MFFVVSKIAGIVLFHPLNFLLFLGLLGLLLCTTRFARTGRSIAMVAAVLLLVAAFSPLSALILRPLEDRFPQPPADMAAPSGIVVLGGALDEDLGLARGQPTLTEAAARLTTGVALALRYPRAYPVDYRTFGDRRDYKPTTLALDSLRRLETALHEWVGLVAYRQTGKTDALFPAP